jgi:ABC-type glycerol-3-phosphate transport system substrate-binding protein
MKRLIVILIVFFALTGMVFGAGAPKVVQIMHVWGNPAEKAIIDQIVANFEAKHPEYKVEQLVYDTASFHQKIIQLLAGNTPPDVFISYPGARTFELVDKGVLEPLNGMWDKYKLSGSFTDETKKSLTYKGKVWNIPTKTNVNIVMYNKQLFAKLGLSEPKTFEEFEKICQQVKSAGIYPLASGWKSLYRSAYPMELLLPSLGGSAKYIDLASLNTDWNDPVAREMLGIWKRWVELGYWFPDGRARSWPEGLNILKEGKAAMDFTGSYAIAVMEGIGWKYGVDYDVFVFPRVNSKFDPTLTGPYDALSIPKKARNKEGASAFLAYMASEEVQKIQAKNAIVLNKNVKEYPPALRKILDQAGPKVAIVGGFFVIAPPMGFQRINQELATDFYDKPDVEYFIAEANKIRDAYRKQR